MQIFLLGFKFEERNIGEMKLTQFLYINKLKEEYARKFKTK